MKKRQQAREEQEERIFALKIQDESAADTLKEQQEAVDKRVQLRKEEAQYREYLKNEKLKEEQRELEIEKIIQKDVDMQQAKKREERLRRKHAREEYLQEVLTVRKQQVEDRKEEKRREKLELEIEREKINKIMGKHNEYQRSKNAYEANKAREYSNDLLAQIDYGQFLKTLFQHFFTCFLYLKKWCQKNKCQQRNRLLDAEEYNKGLKTEMNYESRLREICDRKDIQRVHPLRRHAIRSGRTVIFKD